MFKVNNKDTRTTLSVVNFEYVIAGWVTTLFEIEVKNLIFITTFILHSDESFDSAALLALSRHFFTYFD